MVDILKSYVTEPLCDALCRLSKHFNNICTMVLTLSRLFLAEFYKVCNVLQNLLICLSMQLYNWLSPLLYKLYIFSSYVVQKIINIIWVILHILISLINILFIKLFNLAFPHFQRLLYYSNSLMFLVFHKLYDFLSEVFKVLNHLLSSFLHNLWKLLTTLNNNMIQLVSSALYYLKHSISLLINFTSQIVTNINALILNVLQVCYDLYYRLYDTIPNTTSW